MTKEEQLRVYSAYLPYQLKTQYDNGDIVTIIGVNTETLQVNSEFTHYGYSDTRIDDVKPVLYPLEYLTKEIEHEGQTIIPVELVFGKNHNIREVKDEFIINKHGYSFTAIKLTYIQVNKLLEMHFNVFNLTESEYINKATLTNK